MQIYAHKSGAASDIIAAKLETALGAAMAAVPLLAHYLQSVLSWFTLICGAIVAGHGVWRIYTHHRHHHRHG